MLLVFVFETFHDPHGKVAAVHKIGETHQSEDYIGIRYLFRRSLLFCTNLWLLDSVYLLQFFVVYQLSILLRTIPEIIEHRDRNSEDAGEKTEGSEYLLAALGQETVTVSSSVS